MGAVTEADFRGILRFIDASAAGTRTDPVPRATLSALGELIGGDVVVEYFELRRADRALLGWATTYEWDVGDAEVDEAITAYGHQNPLRWRLFSPAVGALRLSGVISRRELHRLDFYQAVMKPYGVSDTLKVWLASSPYSAACVCIYRLGGDFSQRDSDLLGVAQSHLIAMRDAALAREAAWCGDAVHLTAREAEVLSWVARGKRNDEIGGLLFMTPNTVRKHLEHAYEKLGVHSRSEALARLSLAEPPS